MSTVACQIPEIANSRLKSTVEGPNKYVCVCVCVCVCVYTHVAIYYNRNAWALLLMDILTSMPF